MFHGKWQPIKPNNESPSPSSLSFASESLELRPVIKSDLPTLFEQQADPVSSKLAGVPSRDKEAFDAHWAKILSDAETTLRTIALGDEVVGCVLSFHRNGVREVGYWLGRAHWGKGIASVALARFLTIELRRPLFGGVVQHNPASVRVLEKNGFRLEGEEDGFLILKLE